MYEVYSNHTVTIIGFGKSNINIPVLTYSTLDLLCFDMHYVSTYRLILCYITVCCCLISDAGAWLVEQKVEERRIKELVHTKLRTYEQIRELRIKAEKNGTSIDVTAASTDKDEEDLVLDGFFLVMLI